MEIDPKVELLADIPISAAEYDLFDRQRDAVRLVEIVAAPPTTAPRVVALTGACGTGKTSVLNMFGALIASRSELAMVSVDALLHASAASLMSTLGSGLDKLFSELGVAEKRDKVRDTLVHYGGIVSGLIRIAGVKVDVTSALERSAQSLQTEISRNLEEAGKRLVIVMDHLDRLPPEELGGAFAALRMYAAIPYIAVVIAVDRHEIATRPASATNAPRAFERLVHIELVMSRAAPEVLARVMVGGIRRIAERSHRDLTPALTLFDTDGLGLALIETPRDAKRAINALAAALPLSAPDENSYLATLELLLRVLVPELDVALLYSRHRVAETDRETLFNELALALANQPRAVAARVALRALVIGD